jgi:hypothetical protein
MARLLACMACNGSQSSLGILLLASVGGMGRKGGRAEGGVGGCVSANLMDTAMSYRSIRRCHTRLSYLTSACALSRDRELSSRDEHRFKRDRLKIKREDRPRSVHLLLSRLQVEKLKRVGCINVHLIKCYLHEPRQLRMRDIDNGNPYHCARD